MGEETDDHCTKLWHFVCEGIGSNQHARMQIIKTDSNCMLDSDAHTTSSDTQEPRVIVVGRPDVSDDVQGRAQEAVARCCRDKDPTLAATAALSIGHAGCHEQLPHLTAFCDHALSQRPFELHEPKLTLRLDSTLVHDSAIGIRIFLHPVSSVTNHDHQSLHSNVSVFLGHELQV